MEDVMMGAKVTRKRTSGTGAPGVNRGNGRLIAAASWLLGVVILLESDPAWAQITKVNTVMQNVQTVLTSVAGTLFTVAIMWAGFKMAFSHAQWSDVSNVVIGGILVGGAAGIAAWLINEHGRLSRSHLHRLYEARDVGRRADRAADSDDE